MLSGFENAAVTAARLGAANNYTITTATGTEFVGDAANEDFNITSVEDGDIFQMPEGWEFKSIDHNYPNIDTGDFIKASLRGSASGMGPYGASYNAIGNDLEGVSFSSIRVAVQEEREAWKALQGWMIDSFLMPVFREWLTFAVPLGKISGAGFTFQMSRLENLQNVQFLGRRWEWIDPLKDARANETLNKMQVKPRAEIIRERGNDPDDIKAEIETERVQDGIDRPEV